MSTPPVIPAVTMQTRWRDAKGREWRIVEKLPFGQNVCTTVDGRVQGYWTSWEIRAAIRLAEGAAIGDPAAKTDYRESRETRIALAADGGVMAVLCDSRRRVRTGSLKAAQRLDRAIAVIAKLVAADQELDAARQYWDENQQVRAASSRLDRAWQQRAEALRDFGEIK